jgi:DNA helicase-2/ATP-dependent DNA helicase PcrA
LLRLSAHLERLRGPVAHPAETVAEAAACLGLTWPPELDARSLAWLWAAARQAETLEALLDRRALRATEDREDRYEGRVERVALLTLHAAKGLEFRAVFIVGCEDGTLPWIRAGADEPESPHEERRLLYVGMTRAMDRLWLGAARRLRRHGKTREALPSRFLRGVSPRLLRVTEHRPPRRVHQRQLDLD